MKSGSEDWLYIYTADDERIWSYKPAANLSRWTLRGLDNKVLREYQNEARFPRSFQIQLWVKLSGKPWTRLRPLSLAPL